MIHVAITDDHPLVIKGLKDMLSDVSTVKVVASFSDALSTGNRIGDTPVDILLLDVNLPDGSGHVLCANLLEQYPSLGIIALTSHDEVIIAKDMLQAGANGFLLKTVSKIELIEAIHEVADGRQFIQESMQQKIMRDALAAREAKDERPLLTKRESEVLALILDECTTKEIAARLFLSPKTIESHRAVLFQKFGVRNVAGLVKKAIALDFT